MTPPTKQIITILPVKGTQMHSNHFGRLSRLRYQYSPSMVRGNEDQRR
jgi:hypothetical protein